MSTPERIEPIFEEVSDCGDFSSDEHFDTPGLMHLYFYHMKHAKGPENYVKYCRCAYNLANRYGMDRIPSEIKGYIYYHRNIILDCTYTTEMWESMDNLPD